MRKKQAPYIAADFNSNSLLSSEECMSLIASVQQNMSFSQDQLSHIFNRSLATTNYLRQVRVDFDNELRKRSAIGAQNAASSVDPMTAAKFLTPEQRLQLADQMTKEKLAILDRKIKISEESTLLLKEITRNIDLTTLPKELRERVENIGE